MQDNILTPNYSHLKGERYPGDLKPLDLKVHSYCGLVVPFKHIFTKPKTAKKGQDLFSFCP